MTGFLMQFSDKTAKTAQCFKIWNNKKGPNFKTE